MSREAKAWRAAAALACVVVFVAPASASAARTNLAISKTDSPDPVRAGNLLTYTIDVANLGPADATGVEVSDKLDSGVDFVRASASQGACALRGRTVTCALGDLRVSEYSGGARVTIVVRPRKAGQVTNTATVTPGPGDTDPNLANNTATTTTAVTAAPGGGGGGGGGGAGGGGGGAACAGRAATRIGTRGADVIVGTGKRDVIVALGGNDRVRGLRRGDIVCGGGGRDKIRGGSGGDRLKGGRGKDKLRGGKGNDDMVGGGGNDRCFGGPGSDTKRSC